MSTDQPPPGEPPEDPFLKKPQEPTPPSGGSPYGSPPPGGTPPPPPGGPYGGSGAGGGYPPPPPPYGGGGPGDPYGSSGYAMPDPLAGMPPLADTGKRFVARIIDWLIVGIPIWLIWFLIIGVTYRGDPYTGEDTSDAAANWSSGGVLLLVLIGIAAYVVYDWYFTHRSGQTLGKKAMRLRVAMLNDGSVPSSKAAFGRAAVLWLPSLLCCGGLWWIIVGISILVDKPYQQGLHDKAAKTVVVQST
ncbi:RDD family protein [Streptomyces sp. ISL-94]|uniref:RDD family protein n=1 Tax=Streptomyces sp. ISL-94 TaxID=2819190 RepID=UPI001BEAE6CE|nr:RDD family protein [Streptomyces sp. ISL-94]MBT2480969.1 RDD family protein [Streptomyces sp. ISL-94]